MPVDPAQDLIRIQNLAKGGKRTLRVKPRSGQSMTVGASYNDNKYMVDLGDEAGADDKWRLVIGKRPHVTIQNTANNNAIEVRKRGVARDADIGPLFVDWRPRVTTGRWRILQMSDGRVLSTESRPDRSPYAMCESELVGGSGGGPFDDLAQLDFRPEGVAKIRIWTNENCISAIQISYRSPDGGKIFECPRRGSGGHETAPFELAPHETIVEMDITGDQLLRWVQFKTNRSRSSPAYGHGRAGALVKLVTGEVLGFFGRSGLLIDALGAYLAPK